MRLWASLFTFKSDRVLFNPLLDCQCFLQFWKLSLHSDIGFLIGVDLHHFTESCFSQPPFTSSVCWYLPMKHSFHFNPLESFCLFTSITSCFQVTDLSLDPIEVDFSKSWELVASFHSSVYRRPIFLAVFTEINVFPSSCSCDLSYKYLYLSIDVLIHFIGLVISFYTSIIINQ